MEQIWDLQKEYAGILQKMLDSTHDFRFLTERGDDGSQHVEIAGDEYHLITTERGLELERKKTRDKDELFYWLIGDTAFWRGVDFELKNRIPGQDCRRLIFAIQIELLKKINPAWARRKQKEIKEILAQHPFNDR